MLTVHTVPEGRPVSLKITTGLTGEDAGENWLNCEKEPAGEICFPAAEEPDILVPE
jgi:hypothetical protein